MKVSHKGGSLRLRLDPTELGVLELSLDDLIAGLDELGPGDPVWERLNPAAFADLDDAQEFRDMIGEDLDQDRRDRLGECRAELAASALPQGGLDLRLEVEAAQRWLTALNDLRLALGTRLEITAADDGTLDPGDPEIGARAVYYWLTALQDRIIDAVMG